MSELLQGPAHLGRLGLRDLAAGLGGEEIVAAAVGVELPMAAGEQTMPLDGLDQAPEAGARTLLLDQEGRVDRAGGVIPKGRWG
jgi:hypothetical protein